MLPDWPRALGLPRRVGSIRSKPVDFQVYESLPFAASGDGEFVLLEVEKRELNTHDVVRRLARFADVAPRAVSYAGLKDRHAVTRQFFSVHLIRRREPDWAVLTNEKLTVLSAQRHHRKLRIGALAGNRFVITIRGLSKPLRDDDLAKLAEVGVPNYFGAQRFGHHGDNITAARAMFDGRRVDRARRSMLLSAARSLIFNDYLAQRVTDGSWNQYIPGDVLMLAGTGSHFVATENDDLDALRQRINEGDLHPGGPLFGKAGAGAVNEAAELEQTVFDQHQALCSGLLAAGLRLQRRALRLQPEELVGEPFGDDAYRVSFSLPAGCYATTVLRELVDSDSG